MEASWRAARGQGARAVAVAVASGEGGKLGRGDESGEGGEGRGGGLNQGSAAVREKLSRPKTCLKKRRANANFIVEQGGREQKKDITFFQRG